MINQIMEWCLMTTAELEIIARNFLQWPLKRVLANEVVLFSNLILDCPHMIFLTCLGFMSVALKKDWGLQISITTKSVKGALITTGFDFHLLNLYSWSDSDSCSICKDSCLKILKLNLGIRLVLNWEIRVHSYQDPIKLQLAPCSHLDFQGLLCELFLVSRLSLAVGHKLCRKLHRQALMVCDLDSPPMHS